MAEVQGQAPRVIYARTNRWNSLIVRYNRGIPVREFQKHGRDVYEFKEGEAESLKLIFENLGKGKLPKDLLNNIVPGGGSDSSTAECIDWIRKGGQYINPPRSMQYRMNSGTRATGYNKPRAK